MKRSFFVLFSIILIVADTTNALASFSDVSKLNPHYNAISYVQSEGIVSGYPDGSFKPDKLVNRAEFVKILVGSALDYDPSQDPSGFDIYALVGIDLTDISNGEWYVPFVRKAIQNDIIAGYPDKTFKPLNNINKAEAAKIIVKSFGLETLAESYNTNWFDIYIYALEEAGAVPSSLACLDQNVTRGELAEMIYRVRSKLTTQDSAHSYIKMASKLRFTHNASMNGMCDSKGSALPASETKEVTPATPAETEELMTEPLTVTLDDSDTENGSTMYDFDTQQRTNTNVYIDMMLSGMFYESSWMRGVDWQVVRMEEAFDSITSCPANGYASAYDIDENGFGSPFNAWQGDVYCLKTNDNNYVLLEVLSSYNEGDNRFLTFKYLMNRNGSTKIR